MPTIVTSISRGLLRIVSISTRARMTTASIELSTRGVAPNANIAVKRWWSRVLGPRQLNRRLKPSATSSATSIVARHGVLIVSAGKSSAVSEIAAIDDVP